MPDVKIGKLHFCGEIVSDCVGFPEYRSGDIPESMDADGLSFTITPNPSTGFFRAEWDSSGYSQMQVLSLNGDKIHQIEIAPDTTFYEVNAGKLPAGVYLVRMTGAQKMPAQKMLIINR